MRQTEGHLIDLVGTSGKVLGEQQGTCSGRGGWGGQPPSKGIVIPAVELRGFLWPLSDGVSKSRHCSRKHQTSHKILQVFDMLLHPCCFILEEGFCYFWLLFVKITWFIDTTYMPPGGSIINVYGQIQESLANEHQNLRRFPHDSRLC